jgi:cytochrome P450 monooxygenase OleP
VNELPFPPPDPGVAGPAPGLTGPLRDGRLPNGTPATLVCGAEELRAFLTDGSFSREAAAAHGMTARSKESLALNSVDPPDHTRRRRTVASAFTSRRAEDERPRVRRDAEELARGLRARGGRAELLADFGLPLSVGVICRVMGVPAADLPVFGPLVDVMMSTAGHSPQEVRAAHTAMFDYFSGLFTAREGRGRDGTVLADLAAAVDGGVLTRDEAVHVAYGLLMAGYETTTNQIAICVSLLLAERTRWERLRSGEDDLATAVEEMLRWTSLLATGGAPHVATADTAVGVREVRAGEVVVPVFAAANRDPRAFGEPDRLRLDRREGSHLAFGHGRHLCLGAPLARVELQEALGVLLRELPDLELAVPADELTWRHGTFIRGLTALPVRWRAAEVAA